MSELEDESLLEDIAVEAARELLDAREGGCDGARTGKLTPASLAKQLRQRIRLVTFSWRAGRDILMLH